MFMGKKSVVSLGVEIPGSKEKYLSLESKASLLDYDVIIIDPSIYGFYGFDYKDYQGKPCLDDSNSFRLKEHIEHWRREIIEAIKAGKNVFLMLNQIQEVFVATGEKSFSGTGKNRQTTRHVSLVSNYEIVPSGISVTNSNGSAMKLVGKNNLLASYWTILGDKSKFKILIDEKEGVEPLIQTKSGQKTVGARIHSINANGNLLLLPYIDFELAEYTYEDEEDGEEYWTEEAEVIGKQLISSICAIDKAIKSMGKLSVIPDWLTQAHLLQCKFINIY
jgi:hypothetical protein